MPLVIRNDLPAPPRGSAEMRRIREEVREALEKTPVGAGFDVPPVPGITQRDLHVGLGYVINRHSARLGRRFIASTKGVAGLRVWREA